MGFNGMRFSDPRNPFKNQRIFDFRLDFHRDVRILAALEDVNIARVLGMCSHEEPLCVVMEYLDHGDLNQFLKTHVPADGARTLPVGVKTLR